MNCLCKRLIVTLLPTMLVFGCALSNEGTEPGVPLSFTVIGTGYYLGGGDDMPKIFATYSDQASYDRAVN